MESGIQSSFIPHDTAQDAVRAARNASGGAGLPELALLLGIVAIIASGALAIGVFLYQKYLDTSTAAKVASLQRAKAEFEPSLIQQLTRLDDRMHAGDGLLGNHLSPSAFFDALNQATLTTVSFSSLTLQANDAQHIVIAMDGVAQSVNSIALQAEIFSKNGVISNPIFSAIERQADGVHFRLSALINPASINYVRNLSTQVAGQQMGSPSGQVQTQNNPPSTTEGAQSPFGDSGTPAAQGGVVRPQH